METVTDFVFLALSGLWGQFNFLNRIRGAWAYKFQKWSLEEKVECSQTTTDQGVWAVQGRKGWRGNWALLWNFCGAREADFSSI